MRYLIALMGRVTGIVGRLTLAALPFAIAWALYDTFSNWCFRVRNGQVCYAENPISFWGFSSILIVGALGAAFVAYVVIGNFCDTRRERRNQTAQQHSVMDRNKR